MQDNLSQTAQLLSDKERAIMEEMQEKQDLQTEDIQVAPTEQTFATEQVVANEQVIASEQVVASEQD
ncbi:MAG: hypothetical protein RR416_06470, partial [Clostridia bacterium]